MALRLRVEQLKEINCTEQSAQIYTSWVANNTETHPHDVGNETLGRGKHITDLDDNRNEEKNQA